MKKSIIIMAVLTLATTTLASPVDVNTFNNRVKEVDQRFHNQDIKNFNMQTDIDINTLITGTNENRIGLLEDSIKGLQPVDVPTGHEIMTVSQKDVSKGTNSHGRISWSAQEERLSGNQLDSFTKSNSDNILIMQQNSVAMSGAIKGNISDIESNRNDIAQNMDKIGANSNRIDSIQTQVGVNTTDIRDIKQHNETQDINISNNATGVKTNADNIHAASIERGKMNTEINNNRGMIFDNMEDIEENSRDMNKNRAAIEDNTDSINDNTKSIEYNRSDIRANSSNITSNTTEIKRNASRIEEVNSNANRGTAMAIATASISYPSLEKGDLGIGAGVGTYQQEQAISLGAKLKVSENLDMNINISTTGENIGAGAGVGYKINLF